VKSEKDMTGSAQPFLRWAGSKRKQLSVLSRFWNPDFGRYVEPFMGSACLFFKLRPQRAFLGDINDDLIRTFLAVRDHPQAVANRISNIRRGKRSYYAIRKQQLARLDAVDAAARFIFLNRYCFNGLYRTNNDGQFNVPFASSRTGRLPTARELRAASNALRSCTIERRDFEQTLRQTKSGDFVYLDPPYAVTNRRVFRQYGPSSFGLHDLQRLADALESMHNRRVKFLLSYASCSEASIFFKRWPSRNMYVQRNIAGFAMHRRRATEVLISNCFRFIR
jgi:DNA adenine methylase